MKKKLRLPILLAGLLSGAAVTLYLVYFYAFGYAVNSDNMYFVRAAEDQLRGNLLLRHWTGGFFSGLTTDMLWAMLLRAVFSRKVTLYLIGPLCLTLIALAGCFLISCLSAGKRFPGIFAVLSVIAVPPAMRHSMLTVGMHNIAILIILCLFLCMAAAEKKPRPGVAAFVLLLFFGIVGDGYVLYYFAIPCLAAACLHYFSGSKARSRLFWLGTVLTGIAAQGFLFWMKKNGFLLLQSAGASLIAPAEIGKYLLNAADTWLRIFGVTLFSQGLTVTEILSGIFGLAAALAVIGCVLSFLPVFFKQNLIVKTMLLSFIFVFGSFILTDVTRAEPAFRYLSPAFYIGLVLTGIRVNQWTGTGRSKIIALLILPLMLFAAGNLSFAFRASPEPDRGYIELADSLIERDVTAVYATYWESHALNYYSDNRVQAAPVIAEGGEIVPYAWSADARWYEPSYNADALVISKNKPYAVTEALAASLFGDPEERLELKDCIVLFYDMNLSAVVGPLRKEE